MSKLYDQLQGAERERIEREKAAEQVASTRVAEEKRGLDLARERQAAEVELRRLAHARAEAETKAAANNGLTVLGICGMEPHRPRESNLGPARG